MNNYVRVFWKRVDHLNVEVYVILKEIEVETKFFGMALDLRVSQNSAGTYERVVVGNAVRALLDDTPTSLLRNLLITFGEFDQTVTRRWSSLWIKEERRVSKVPIIHEAWEQLQDSKTRYLPLNWPLLGMKPLLGEENFEEEEND